VVSSPRNPPSLRAGRLTFRTPAFEPAMVVKICPRPPNLSAEATNQTVELGANLEGVTETTLELLDCWKIR
jgi:hypothetical protein